MKLTKGKINKIKGKRNQSKKRLGHKHKHLVKHGRGLSYRKKRHFNLKNQTLKRFGIEVGGNGVVSNVNDGSKDANDVNNQKVNNSNDKLSSNVSSASNASNASNASSASNADAEKKKQDKASKTISSAFKNLMSSKKKNSDSTNANETNVPVVTTDAPKSATTTVPVESNVASNSTTTTNDNKPTLPVATNVTPVYAIPVNGEDQTHDYNNMYNAMYNANNASESTSTSTASTATASTASTPSNRNISKSTNRGNIRRDLTAIQPVPIKSVTPAPKRAVTTTPPIIDNKITPTPVVVTPSTPKTIATIPVTAPIDEKNQTPSTSPPQFVNLPDHFGPSTTMAELANYFSNVFLVQLMSKFDINTSMTLRDILLTMNKVNNNMGNNMGLNSNGIGSGSVNTNRSDVVNANTRNSKDLLNDLKITYEPGIDKTGVIDQNQSSTTASENTDNYPGMGTGMGMGMGMGMPMDMNQNMNTPMDTRSRLDIQNENANMDLQNTKLSAENNSLNAEKASLTEAMNKNTKDLEELKKDPTANAERIKQLETENTQHQLAIKEKEVQITKNQNEQADIQRKLKANKYAEWKTKSNWEVASEVGSSAYDYGKRGVNAVGDAATSALKSGKNLLNGPDYDTINANREKLLDQQKVSNDKIAELEKQINETNDPAITKKLKDQRDTEKKNLEKYENKLNKNEELYQKNQTKLQDIKDQVSNKNDDDEMPRTVSSPVIKELRNTNRISDEREDEHPTSTVLQGQKANENAQHEIIEKNSTGSRIIDHSNKEGDIGNKPGLLRQASNLFNDIGNTKESKERRAAELAEKKAEENKKKRLETINAHAHTNRHHVGGKKTKTKKTRKLQKR